MNVLERIKNGETEVMILDITEFNGIPGKVQADEGDKEELIRLSEIGQRMKWISVDDEVPLDGEKIDVIADGERVTCCIYSGEEFTWGDGYFHTVIRKNVTHWMPIPELPNMED